MCTCERHRKSPANRYNVSHRLPLRVLGHISRIQLPLRSINTQVGEARCGQRPDCVARHTCRSIVGGHHPIGRGAAYNWTRTATLRRRRRTVRPANQSRSVGPTPCRSTLTRRPDAPQAGRSTVAPLGRRSSAVCVARGPRRRNHSMEPGNFPRSPTRGDADRDTRPRSLTANRQDPPCSPHAPQMPAAPRLSP